MNRRLPFTLIFATFAIFLLLGLQQPYLLETAALTPFYTDESLCDLCARPCGLLLYVAAGLQSCFAVPWLGAILFVALLVALAYVQKWVFRVSDSWFGLCWVVPFALLVNYTQLGYLIYTLKHPAVAFAEPLGFFFAFCLMGLWYRLKDRWWQLAFLLLAPLLGFCLLGFFGLVVAPFLGFSEMGKARFKLIDSPSKRRGDFHFLWGLALFLSGTLLFSFFRALVFPSVSYEVGHLAFTNDLQELRIPWGVVLVFPSLFAFSRFEGQKLWHTAVAAIVFVAVGVAAYSYSFLDSNFLSILRMKHAAEDGRWEQVLQLAKAEKQEPTRAQVCLTRLALFKTGRMGDELFAYPDGSAAYKAPQKNQWLRLMIGSLLYYHYGKLGFAYRWAMEDLVEYGERPASLRYLHRVALLNGEEALAARYARALARTLFYKSEAAHASAPEASSIRPLLNYTDQLDGDNGLVEFYLLQSFVLSEGGSREMVELSLMNSLITKKLSNFWPRFFALLPTWKDKIPTHYQEAALMVAQLQGGVSVADLPIDTAIGKRFQRLVQASAQGGDNAANGAFLRPEFGNTYWYYYFFVEGLKTN